jgi:hypothetical protein
MILCFHPRTWDDCQSGIPESFSLLVQELELPGLNVDLDNRAAGPVTAKSLSGSTVGESREPTIRRALGFEVSILDIVVIAADGIEPMENARECQGQKAHRHTQAPSKPWHRLDFARGTPPAKPM